MKKSPVSLIYGESNFEIESANVPVRWCVSKEIQDKLKEKSSTPYITMVVEKNGILMHISQEKLGEVKSFLDFYRSGSNNVYYFISSRKMEFGSWEKDRLIRKYLSDDKKENKSKLEWLVDLYDDNSDTAFENNFSEWENDSVLFVGKEVIDIPEGVFGKEPSEFMKGWINKWHSDNYTNDCQRRSRTWGVPFKMIVWSFAVLMLNIALKPIVATLAIFMGVRKEFKFKSFLKFVKTPSEMIDNEIRYKSWEDNDFYYSFGGRIKFTPVATHPIFSIIFLLLFLLPSKLIIIFLSIYVLLVLFSVLVDAFLLLSPSIKSKMPKIAYNSNLFFNILIAFIVISFTVFVFYLGSIAIWLVIYASIVGISLYGLYRMLDQAPESSLLCPTDLDNFTTYIPSKKTSIKLKYKELKHKVCKPSQR